jgi:hypothetical protein
VSQAEKKEGRERGDEQVVRSKMKRREVHARRVHGRKICAREKHKRREVHQRDTTSRKRYQERILRK